VENGGLASCLRAGGVNQPFWKNLNVPHNPKPQNIGRVNAGKPPSLHHPERRRERERERERQTGSHLSEPERHREMEVMDQVILTSSFLLLFLQG